MTDPIFEPESGPAPKRRTGLWVTLAVIVVLAVLGTGMLLATRGTDTPNAEPTATPTPTATPSPTPSTPEEQAVAEIEQVVAVYTATTNELYADPTKDPNDIANSTRGELREYRILRHMQFRNTGQTFTSGEGVVVTDVEVTDLDLAADPPSAVVRVCEAVQAAGTDMQGQPTDHSSPPQIAVYPAQYLPSGSNGAGEPRWFLTSSKPTGEPC